MAGATLLQFIRTIGIALVYRSPIGWDLPNRQSFRESFGLVGKFTHGVEVKTMRSRFSDDANWKIKSAFRFRRTDDKELINARDDDFANVEKVRRQASSNHSYWFSLAMTLEHHGSLVYLILMVLCGVPDCHLEDGGGIGSNVEQFVGGCEEINAPSTRIRSRMSVYERYAADEGVVLVVDLIKLSSVVCFTIRSETTTSPVFRPQCDHWLGVAIYTMMSRNVNKDQNTSSSMVTYFRPFAGKHKC
ncbi:hypothetical protein BV22DRAFT_1048720 [Leucogyrophana mollusca]|uniref:Uncharacterized protein n=1 Tax=Leucogyrophana mollusca TaxID=85980 RepID=A0ACB8BD12_9AGAM|nr:hypothetical protein BV22DRAFT_1048720 [Leucogyrophana mollusca]